MVQTETRTVPEAVQAPSVPAISSLESARFDADGRAYPVPVMAAAPATIGTVVIAGGHQLVAESVAMAVSTDAGTSKVRCVASLRALNALDVVPGSVLVLGEAADGSTSDVVRAARALGSREHRDPRRRIRS
jgi:hypothetical protein